MAGKPILIAALILAGCRGSVREGETASQMRAEAVSAPVPQETPLKIDLSRASLGPCSYRRVAVHGGQLRGVSLRAMDRVPISMSAGGPITAAWRIDAGGEQGSGSIVRIEGTDRVPPHYVGSGIFAGCSQSNLTSAYSDLAPPPGAAELELLQLG